MNNPFENREARELARKLIANVEGLKTTKGVALCAMALIVGWIIDYNVPDEDKLDLYHSFQDDLATILKIKENN